LTTPQLAYSKVDVSNPDVKKEAEKILKKDFGILPFHSNYFLPASYSPTKDDSEIEFQISFQKLLSYDLLGFNEYISFAYTQTSFWRAYAHSSPFRETNYIPELFITLPTPNNIDRLSKLKANLV
jgi:phospholipase A1